MFVAQDDDDFAGFSAGYGFRPRRKKHVMNCVIGVLSRASSRGLGTQLMNRLEQWARDHGFSRMELTVMRHNERAQRLSIRCGFEVEGAKKHSIAVDGVPVDELVMAKLLTSDPAGRSEEASS